LYHENHGNSSSVFAILALVFIPISINYIFGTLLTANGSLKQLNYVAGSLAIINIVLNLILVPAHKALGAAMSSLITQSIAVVLQIYLCTKILKIKMDNVFIIKCLIFIALSIISAWFISKLNGIWIWQFFASALVICVMAIITGLVSVKGVLKFVTLQTWGFNE
jgi:O-antigen/teichoic acid export membrane protein